MHLTEKLSNFGVAMPNLSLMFRQWNVRQQPSCFAATDGLTVEWHESWPDDSRIIESWNDLCRNTPTATAFHTPAWQCAQARAFIRARRFRLLTIFRGERLVGVLPLQINGNGELVTPGSVLSDYLDPLIAADEIAAGWNAIFDAINHLPDFEVDRLVLHNCRPECVDQAALQSASLEAGFDVHCEESEQISRVALAKTWDEYLATLDGRDRKELRRKIRNAQTKVQGELLISNTEDEVREACARTFAYIQDAGGNKGLKAQWTYRPIFRRVAGEMVAANRLRVYELQLNGQYAAGLICLKSPTGPMLWTIGHDSQFAQFSPGIVLMGLALQHAIGEGACCFDLLRGSPRYKSDLGAKNWPLHRMTLHRSTAN